MHLPLHTLLLPFFLPLLPHAYPSLQTPHTKRQLICHTTPSPNLQHADCLRALTGMPVPDPHINYHPADLLRALTFLRSGGPIGSFYRLPRSFVAGTCRVNVQLVNGVGAVQIPWSEVRGRAQNVVDFCVDDEVPRGGTSVFSAWKVVVEEVVPRVGAGAP